jgi:hypothetical protein
MAISASFDLEFNQRLLVDACILPSFNTCTSENPGLIHKKVFDAGVAYPWQAIYTYIEKRS